MSQFVVKNFFNNMQVNALLDRMYYQISLALPALDVNSVMCLTGRAAAELQGAAPQACKQVVFLVNDAALYAWVQQDLPKVLPNRGIIRFQERTIFYLSGCVLEIWYREEEIDIRNVSGYYAQFIDDINPILL